jgi:hypothetical protein
VFQEICSLIEFVPMAIFIDERQFLTHVLFTFHLALFDPGSVHADRPRARSAALETDFRFRGRIRSSLRTTSSLLPGGGAGIDAVTKFTPKARLSPASLLHALMHAS